MILLRELSAAFYGVDLIYLLALGAWLLWTAAGALVGRRVLHPSAARVAAVLVATGVVVPLDVALIRRLRLLLGGVPGAFLPLPTQLAASAVCLLPASILLGVLFQWAAKRYLTFPCRDQASGIGGGLRTSDFGLRTSDSKKSLARAYAIESVGGVAGGLATTLTLHWRLPNVALALATGALAFVAAAAPTVIGGKRRQRRDSGNRGTRLQPCDSPGARVVSIIALVGLLLCLLAGWQARRLDRWMTSWNHPDVVESLDSPYGRITVAQRAGQVSAYENDALAFDSEGTGPEEFAHLSLLQHGAPRRVLLVAGATAGLLADIAQHHPERIDDVELDAGAVDLLARRLPGLRQSLSLPAVHLVFDDPRRAMTACVPGSGIDCGNGYDVIVVAAAEPASAQANRFFTREFFRLCAAHLRPGGVVSFRLASIENLWTPPLVARTGSIYVALREVFGHVVVLPGSTNIVLASASPLVRDPQVLAERLAQRAIRTRLVTARYVRYLYSNDRFAELEARLARSHAKANTDANAASYQATSLFWLSKFVPSLARLDLAPVAQAYGWSAPRSWLLLAIATACALVWRRRGWPHRTALVGIAAFAGMMLETLLLLHYQLKHGVVFQDLGVLLMSVMAGLASGAWMVDRGVGARQAVRLERSFLVVLVFLALAVSASVATGYGTGSVPIAIMLFATGVSVAGVFACASLADPRGADVGRPTSPTHPVDQLSLVSPLYAADVFGGCLGSVAASLVLIPLLGLPLTAEWAAALAGVALLLAW